MVPAGLARHDLAGHLAGHHGRLPLPIVQRLDQLDETRRKGYQARTEARLEAEEARWQAARKANC